MAELIGGRIDRASYTALLHNLHAVYAALEPALALATSWAPLLSRLQRLPALRADLAWFSAAAEVPLALVPGTSAYVARLHGLAAQAPHRLAAHAYARYLGDLHGGQILARLVQRRFALPDSTGTAFYRFADAAGVQGLAQALRQLLAALPLAQAQADEVADEACWAFAAHVQIFEELQAPRAR